MRAKQHLGVICAVALLIAACSGDTSGGGTGSDGDSATGAPTDSGSDGGTGGGDGDTGTDGGTDSGSETTTDSTTGPEEEEIDPNELPTEVPTVEIIIDPTAIDLFDQNPFHSEDVLGTFIDGDGTIYENVDLNYRGVYMLQSLIQSGGEQRNWKVKFPKIQKYRNRREWNFNYERHLRQKLSYDLMKFATIKVPDARHVVLLVNGEPHGLYLEYEDPDSKDWLRDKFHDDTGDLYKGGYDLPNELPRWALTIYLGDLDEDYFLHYRKQTNNNGLAGADYHTIREFLQALDVTPDAEIPGWVDQNFDVVHFIDYLVVTNFISNWDSLPQRPKNYWLYDNPRTEKWVFIPWDLDLTFGLDKFPMNPMGTDASIFYQLDEYEFYEAVEGEGTERPLVRRLMEHDLFRDAFVERYFELIETILDRDYLIDRVQKLTDLMEQYASADDFAHLQQENAELVQFINERYDNVTAELDTL